MTVVLLHISTYIASKLLSHRYGRPDYTHWVSRPSDPAAWLIKAGGIRVKSLPDHTNLHTPGTWTCDLCHKTINKYKPPSDVAPHTGYIWNAYNQWSEIIYIRLEMQHSPTQINTKTSLKEQPINNITSIIKTPLTNNKRTSYNLKIYRGAALHHHTIMEGSHHTHQEWRNIHKHTQDHHQRNFICQDTHRPDYTHHSSKHIFSTRRHIITLQRRRHRDRTLHTTRHQHTRLNTRMWRERTLVLTRWRP